jgi:hypothetical protein
MHTGEIGIGLDIFNDLVAGGRLRSVQPPCHDSDGIDGTAIVEHFEM